MNLILRPVREDDSRDVWRWRNHPEALKNFFNNEPVPWRKHKRWFYSKTKDKNTKIYITNLNDDKVGVIRFEIEKSCIKVNIVLNPDFFGRGLGSKIIRYGTEKVLKETGTTKALIAEIKKDNIASQKAFMKAGYRFTKEIEGKLIYIR